jgi:hypothetical protein
VYGFIGVAAFNHVPYPEDRSIVLVTGAEFRILFYMKSLVFDEFLRGEPWAVLEKPDACATR